MTNISFACDHISLEDVIKKHSDCPDQRNMSEIMKIQNISKQTKQYFDALITSYNKFAMIKYILEKGENNMRETLSYVGPLYVNLGTDIMILYFVNYSTQNKEVDKIRNDVLIKIKTLQNDIIGLNEKYKKINCADNSYLFLLNIIKEINKSMEQYIKNAFT
jgi:hypothetical protein